jgi:hypothetical protein
MRMYAKYFFSYLKRRKVKLDPDPRPEKNLCQDHLDYKNCIIIDISGFKGFQYLLVNFQVTSQLSQFKSKEGRR